MRLIKTIFTLSIAMMVGLGSILAQDCNAVVFSVQNTSNDVGALQVNYVISQNGVAVEDGMWSVSPDDGMVFTVCLEVGCYLLSISGEGVNPESVAVEMQTSDTIQLLQWEMGEDGAWITEFCAEEEEFFDCPTAIDFAAGEGCSWAFEIGSFQEGEEVLWNFGDGQESVWGGHFIEYEYEEPGDYQVTAWFTSYLCPMGVELATTIEVDGCGEGNEECEIGLESESIGCHLYEVVATGYPEDASIWWIWQGADLGDGPSITLDVTTIQEGEECGVLEVGFESPNCAFGGYAAEIFCLESCEEECEIDMEVSSVGGMWYTFEVPGLEDGATFLWYIDGMLMEGESSSIFEAGFDFNPYWTVCVEVFTDDCPEGAEACYANMEQTDCPEEINVTSEGCWYLFVIGGNEEAQVHWSVNGILVQESGIAFDINFEESGDYLIEAVYWAEGCDGMTFTIAVNAECGNNDCPIEMVSDEMECDVFFLEALNVPDGANLFWTLDGEPYEYGLAEMVFTIEDEECHILGVGYESDNCPEGFAYSEVQICPDCEEDECTLELVWEPLADGIYLFSAVTSDGTLFEGDLNWWTGGENVGNSNPFAWTWDSEEAGIESMCMSYGPLNTSEICEACIELETSPIACEEVQLVMNADWVAEGSWTFGLLLEAEIEGWNIEGWSFDLNFEVTGSVSDTLTFCIPMACFEVMANYEVPMGGGLESCLIFGFVKRENKEKQH
ncbi:MAG: hypothetical protein OSA37_09415 [Flavobacteriales bacterium]|nr:hypothetical protein [Flavobacteriales bacterium]